MDNRTNLYGFAKFTPEQQSAYRFLESAVMRNDGLCRFLTGKAGSGKSTLIKHLCHTHSSIVRLASTGTAAQLYGGQTVHSFFGFPLGPLPASRVRPLRDRQLAKNAHAFIIEEVSMLSADHLRAIDVCLRKTLEVDKPFGGKSILLVGDPWQLPPIVQDSVRDYMDKNFFSPWFFDAPVFRIDMELEFRELQEVFRQSDPLFVDALNDVRYGGTACLNTFNDRVSNDKRSTILTMGNRRATMINTTAMADVTGDAWVYDATITGTYEAKDMPADESLLLKVGARVMFCRTYRDEQSDTLVNNGRIGTVIEVGPNPRVELKTGEVVTVKPVQWENVTYAWHQETGLKSEQVGTFEQLPLRPAYAVTVHKSQGQTLEDVRLELELPSFAHGQIYVALSRCKSLEGLSLGRRLKESDIVTDPRVHQFFRIPQRRTV